MGKQSIVERTADDKREFRRIRNYYRRTFRNGESDESFIAWVEKMCAEENGYSLEEENEDTAGVSSRG